MRGKLEHGVQRILHVLEFVIAIMTLGVLLAVLAYEVHRMCTIPGYFVSLDNYLKTILSIVVGLEFVRMLIDMTPANTIEVLIVAMARQVILHHDDPVSNLVSVLCIAGLFATRRFLISKEAMKKELSDI